MGKTIFQCFPFSIGDHESTPSLFIVKIRNRRGGGGILSPYIYSVQPCMTILTITKLRTKHLPYFNITKTRKGGGIVVAEQDTRYFTIFV